MVDYASLRRIMVDRQIRTVDVTDPRVLAAFGDVPREAFLPAALHDFAYSDADLPLPTPAWPGRTLTSPQALARLVALAAIGAGDRVLHVGAATGYGTAILAQLAAEVTALEEDAALAAMARAALARLGVGNATVAVGPLAAGHGAGAPYDAILVEGAAEELPDALLSQLRGGGRLVAVMASGGPGRATLFTRPQDGPSGRAAFELSTPALPAFQRAQAFVF